MTRAAMGALTGASDAGRGCVGPAETTRGGKIPGVRADTSAFMQNVCGGLRSRHVPRRDVRGARAAAGCAGQNGFVRHCGEKSLHAGDWEHPWQGALATTHSLVFTHVVLCSSGSRDHRGLEMSSGASVNADCRSSRLSSASSMRRMLPSVSSGIGAASSTKRRFMFWTVFRQCKRAFRTMVDKGVPFIVAV